MINYIKLHANQIRAQTNHQFKLNAVEIKFDMMICSHMRKTFAGKSSHSVNLRSLLPKNPLIKKQTVTSIRNLTLWLIIKYQTTVKPLPTSPFRLVLVKTSNCTNPNTWLTIQQLDYFLWCNILQSMLVDLEATWYITQRHTRSHNSSCKVCISKVSN